MGIATRTRQDEDKTPLSGHVTLRAGHATLRAGYATLRAGHVTLRAGYATLRAGYATLRAGYATLRAGYATLRAGYVTLSGNEGSGEVGGFVGLHRLHFVGRAPPDSSLCSTMTWACAHTIAARVSLARRGTRRCTVRDAPPMRRSRRCSGRGPTPGATPPGPGRGAGCPGR